MSHYTPKLWDDVADRLLSDASLTAITSSIYTDWPPEGTTMPYVVLQYSNAGIEEMFRAKGINVVLDAHVFHEQKGAGDPLSTCSLILSCIEGNWLTNGGTPLNGIERWAPGLAGTGWTAGEFILTNPRERIQEAGVYHFVSTFETLVSSGVTGP